MSRQQTNNFATYKVGLVQPGALSNTQLGPGWYSLSSLSNVPYVTLVGRGGTQKTFTWGELVYIPDGNLVTVKNASYHPGDIFINSGRDFCARPRRITVPVRNRFVPGGNVLLFDWPVDVRGAVRAYLNLNVTADEQGQPVSPPFLPQVATIVVVQGRRIDGSHETLNGIPVGPGFGGGLGYQNGVVVPFGTTFANIPLGMNAVLSDAGATMTLLDTARPLINGIPDQFPTPPNTWTAYYTVEY